MAGDAAFLVGAALFLALIVFCARVRIVRAFVPGLVALVLLYLALPDKMSSGAYVDKRMPIAIAFMLLAGLDVRIRRGAASATLIGLIGLALTIKQAALTVLWRSFDPAIDALAASLERTPAGSVVMQAECEPESNAIAAVYAERQPSMTHLSAMAAFDDARFVAKTWAIAGQQPVAVKPAFEPYYELQIAFGSSSCDAARYRAELRAIEDLAWARKAAGAPAPPIYFLLIRPPKPETLSTETRMIAHGRDFELYAVDAP
jgi:hypothetical protein